MPAREPLAQICKGWRFRGCRSSPIQTLDPGRPRRNIMKSTPRFLVLDSWRGICACLVAMFHLTQYTHVLDIAFIRHAFLFVDFFFVLSGFVITANYADKLMSGFGVKNFMILRFGRVYPIHLFTLSMFVWMAVVRLLKQDLGGVLPFESEAENPYAIVTNILLIHSLGIHDNLTWNYPSWSISTEYYTYLVFSASVIYFRVYFNAINVFVIILAPVFIGIFSPDYIATTYDYGFVRCLYGFCVGSLLWKIYESNFVKYIKHIHINFFFWSAIEIVIVFFIITYVVFSGRSLSSVFAPIVFATSIYCFIFEKGLVSRLLLSNLLTGIGKLSYSIYMMHALVFALGFELLSLVDQQLSIEMLGETDGTRYIGSNPFEAGIIYIAMMLLTVASSRLTYIAIEEPGRAYFRRFVKADSNA